MLTHVKTHKESIIQTCEKNLTHHFENTTAEVFETDPPIRVCVQTFGQLPYLRKNDCCQGILNIVLDLLIVHKKVAEKLILVQMY